jgi:predicted Zn-dependent protease
MEDLVREVVGKAKADFAEVRWEKVFRSRVVFQRNQLMALEATEEGGGIVRALVNGAWGLAVFTDPEELPRKSMRPFIWPAPLPAMCTTK